VIASGSETIGRGPRGWPGGSGGPRVRSRSGLLGRAGGAEPKV